MRQRRQQRQSSNPIIIQHMQIHGVPLNFNTNNVKKISRPNFILSTEKISCLISKQQFFCFIFTLYCTVTESHVWIVHIDVLTHTFVYDSFFTSLFHGKVSNRFFLFFISWKTLFFHRETIVKQVYMVNGMVVL